MEENCKGSKENGFEDKEGRVVEMIEVEMDKTYEGEGNEGVVAEGGEGGSRIRGTGKDFGVG